MKINEDTILFVGGGTLGAVAPLLAVALKIVSVDPLTKIIFVGTNSGPEKTIVENLRFQFLSLPTSKLPRYFTWKIVLMPFAFVGAFLKSLSIVIKYKPKVIFGCGGFSQVPLMIAGFCLGAKIAIHQQDVTPTLSNVLISPISSLLTSVFNDTLQKMPSSLLSQKRLVTGNPIWQRPNSSDGEVAAFNKLSGKPVVLIQGGSSGAAYLNKFVELYKEKLLEKFNVITITGINNKLTENQAGFYSSAFISDMSAAYNKASIVISRAGLNAISEMAHFAKPVILVPMADTHQEQNAKILSENNAAIVVSQKDGYEKLFNQLLALSVNSELQVSISSNLKNLLPDGATEKIVEELRKLL